MMENEEIIEENQPQESSPFTVYTYEGEIIRSGTAPKDQVDIQAREGEMVIREASSFGAQYVSAGRVWDMPLRPSSAHIFDYTKKEWSDPRTLLELRAARWDEIKLARDAAEFGGFVWAGSRFDSDAVSQSRLRGAAQEAAQLPTFARVWTLADNTFRELNAAGMTAVVAALDAHIDRQHALARELRMQINAATNAAQLAGIRWPDPIV
ncbi:DUF4376 domain-containing protein [Pantoea sp. 18069]|uniref:DUF4376 domain-containing protein n=1 Tax=Pantoea sp. 18069 TaxID=2681415 RepID=UPI001359B196|nr:DUF4376 domain-containing protein [Pantoea sp. 18069]